MNNLFHTLLSERSLLAELLRTGGSPDAAWREFLRRYSKLILKMIWQRDREYEEVMEKYLFVCRKLAENDFAILRRYRARSDSAAPLFTTWLAAVTRNLCVDQHRAAHGRPQLPRAILRLPERDREVFRLFYWKGQSREEVEQRMTNNFGMTPDEVAASLSRLEETLIGTSHQRHVEPTSIPFNEEKAEFGSVAMDDDATEMLDSLETWLDQINTSNSCLVTDDLQSGTRSGPNSNYRLHRATGARDKRDIPILLPTND
jgi:DNA-directed RNA polymerase specialized sigma24 family protein